MLCLCHNGPALLRFWFQTDLEHENSASFKNTGGKDLFLPWSRSTSNFYALIAQNLKSEFLRKIMHCLETCLLWQLNLAEFCVNLWFFLTVFFHWMYKMKNNYYQESSVIHGWFVYCVVVWEMHRLSKSEIRFPMASFSFFTLLNA